MCSVDAPEPQVIETEKPTFVRNPFLDDADNDARTADALRRGRSSLVIPAEEGVVGFDGRGGSTGAGGTGIPNGNGRPPGGNAGGGTLGQGTPPAGGPRARNNGRGGGGSGRFMIR